VPLRFVSQALGATVNYDASNRIVALTEIAQQQPPPRDRQPQPPQPREQPPQQAAQRSPLTFVAVHPGSGETVDTRRPTVEADFGNAQANANSIRIDIDGVNVTDQASRSSRGVVFSPPSDLQSGQHTVIVSGTDANGQPFDTRWNFVSGTNADTNSITNLRPGNGANVRDQFTVSGRTTPGARVVVQIGTADRPTAENFLGQLVGAGNGSVNVRSEVTADGNGNFQAPIDIQARQGQALTMVVDSTDARTSAAAPRIVRNLTAE
jgi:hypothetical protein